VELFPPIFVAKFRNFVPIINKNPSKHGHHLAKDHKEFEKPKEDP